MKQCQTFRLSHRGRVHSLVVPRSSLDSASLVTKIFCLATACSITPAGGMEMFKQYWKEILTYDMTNVIHWKIFQDFSVVSNYKLMRIHHHMPARPLRGSHYYDV